MTKLLETAVEALKAATDAGFQHRASIFQHVWSVTSPTAPSGLMRHRAPWRVNIPPPMKENSRLR